MPAFVLGQVEIEESIRIGTKAVGLCLKKRKLLRQEEGLRFVILQASTGQKLNTLAARMDLFDAS